LKNDNNDSLIQFYEKKIENISIDYLNFLKKLKENWELVSLPNLGHSRENVYRIFQTMKIQIQNLFKENEKLSKEVNELKKLERMNIIYKKVINKFGKQIDHNRRYSFVKKI
jgi:hypothetical protein